MQLHSLPDKLNNVFLITKKIIAILAFPAFCFLVLPLQAQELLRIKSFDGEVIEGRLSIPRENFRNKIVIDVPGSGPHTYENGRKVGRSLIFKYHDIFANEFAERGIAYFSYSTRYTRPDSIPPYYDSVDKEKFFAYTPSMKVKDLEEVIVALREDARLSASRFILLGWSEGAVVASMAAERKRAPIDALFLAGSPTEDVYTTILWQLSGASSMITFQKFFDGNKDSIIQRSEYRDADAKARVRVGDKSFEELDMNNDTVLTMEDFRLTLQPRLESVVAAIDRNDNDWLWESFFRVGAKWIQEHRDIEANKSRLLRLDVPVFIFHGEQDPNAPVEGILQMRKEAEKRGKRNLRFFIFPEHDHSLEFLAWVVRKKMPEGLKAIFDQVDNF